MNNIFSKLKGAFGAFIDKAFAGEPVSPLAKPEEGKYAAYWGPSPSPQTAKPMASAQPSPMASPKQQYQAPSQFGRAPQGSPSSDQWAFDWTGATRDKEPVIQAITRAASQYGVPPELLFDIAASESSLNPGLQNTTPEGQAVGVPQGLFQFTPQTWTDVLNYAKKGSLKLDQSATREDPYSNAAAAAYLISKGQLGKWYASEDKWGDYWTPQELEDMGFFDQTIYHEKGKRFSERKKR